MRAWPIVSKRHFPSKIDICSPLIGHDWPGHAQNPFHLPVWNYSPAMQSNGLRKTKIIATLGPATDSAEMISRLIHAGVNVFRLNMSHAPHEWVRRVVQDIRAASTAAGCYAGIMMDT